VRFLSVVLLIVSARIATAEVVPHPLFGDGAVLQRGRVVPVWGTATDGERVRVSIQKQVRETVCRDGRWRVELEPLEAGGPFALSIEAGGKTTTRQVWAGDVWLASGQSNMDLTVVDSDRAVEEIAAADHPEIHFCKVPRQAADELPQTLPVK
jgi:sialate O-acetylesterase